MNFVYENSQAICLKILATETSNLENIIPKSLLSRAMSLLDVAVAFADPQSWEDVDEICADINSCYSGGPCGPYTVRGAIICGALAVIGNQYGMNLWEEKVQEIMAQEDPVEYLLKTYYRV